MKIAAGKSYVIEFDQAETLSGQWTVKVYKRGFPCRQRLSSDWFLDGGQAKKFVDELQDVLSGDQPEALIRSRHPGWTLDRPGR